MEERTFTVIRPKKRFYYTAFIDKTQDYSIGNHSLFDKYHYKCLLIVGMRRKEKKIPERISLYKEKEANDTLAFKSLALR